jgi:hypothetical protein
MRSRKPFWLLVIALLATALLAAGCGGDDKKKSDTTTAAQTDTSGGAGGGDTSTDTSGGDSGGGAADPNIQAAIDACKQQIASQPTLSDGVKTDLNKICEQIKSGDEAQIRQTAKDVCNKIVDEAGIPDGPAKDQAKQACDQAGATP